MFSREHQFQVRRDGPELSLDFVCPWSCQLEPLETLHGARRTPSLIVPLRDGNSQWLFWFMAAKRKRSSSVPTTRWAVGQPMPVRDVLQCAVTWANRNVASKQIYGSRCEAQAELLRVTVSEQAAGEGEHVVEARPLCAEVCSAVPRPVVAGGWPRAGGEK
jgi:hypothetical protein